MKIGIEGPPKDIFDEQVIQKVIQADHGALTTSGNYRKFIQKDGKTFSHIMDPKTGYPIQNELISVTVWAKDAITADGYDNALMGMGLKKALLFMKQHTDMEAYFIYRGPNGSISDTATTGFYNFFKQ
jgi:thiamine biosynthesis lipoprotein